MIPLDIDTTILDEMSEKEVKEYLNAKYGEYADKVYEILILTYKKNDSV